MIFSPDIVRHTTCAIWCSNRGMSEGELLELLARTGMSEAEAAELLTVSRVK